VKTPAPLLQTTHKIRQIKGVTGLSEESSQVRQGDVFIACASDLFQRAEHIKQAEEKGAVGFVVDAQAPEPRVAWAACG
jgi:UDP-N-acetylmuramyl tripeptide synthase